MDNLGSHNSAAVRRAVRQPAPTCRYSNTSCAVQRNEPPKRPGGASEPCSTASHLPNAQTTSKTPDTLPNKVIALAATLALLFEARQPVVLWGAPGTAKSALDGAAAPHP